jgi:hypothetical protein
MARTTSLSENCAMSPKSEEQADDSGSTSSYPEVKLIEETNVENVPFSGFYPGDEVAMSSSSQGPEMKFDPADEPMTVTLDSVPASEALEYYEPSWGSSTAVVHRTPEVYQHPQYAGAPAPWYGVTPLGPAQGPSAPASVNNQVWSDYRHGFGPFQPATLPDKVMNEAVSHNAGFGNMHQIVMSAPFVQPAVPATSENQQVMYQDSRMQYAHDAYGQPSQAGYSGAHHQEMYTGWI